MDENGQIVVTVRGVDVFDTKSGDVRSCGTGGDRRLVHRHRLQRGELLRSTRLLPRSAGPLQVPEDLAQGRDRQGSVGDPLPGLLVAFRQAFHRPLRGQGHQPLRRRGHEGVWGVERWLINALRFKYSWDLMRNGLTGNIPRMISVTRIIADIASNDGEESSHIARETVLRWVGRKSGALPEPARNHQSFELDIPGRRVAGVRLQSDDVDYWAIRHDDIDRQFARVWTTEVTVASLGEVSKFAVRLDLATREAHPEFEPSVPSFVRSVAESPGIAPEREADQSIPSDRRHRGQTG